MKKILFLFILTSILSNSCKQTKLVFPLDSRDLTQEFIENKSKAQKKYKDKILIIEGRISHIYENKYGNTVILLAYKRDTYGVLCTLKLGTKLNKPLVQNSLIEIKGYFEHFEENIILKNCVILKR